MATYRNARFKQSPEDFIRGALARAGVDNFWQASAFGYIRGAMNGNRHFFQSVEAVTVQTNKALKYASRVDVTGVACFPDIQREARVSLVYTFNPKAHKAHQTQFQTLTAQ